MVNYLVTCPYRFRDWKRSSPSNVTLCTQNRYRKDNVRGLLYDIALPSQNMNRNFERISGPIDKNRDDNELCREILESDPAIRVAAFIEGAEVTGIAETARVKISLSKDNDLRRKIGVWARLATEMSRQVDQTLGNTESITFTHKAVKMVTVPLSANRSLGLSLDRSANADHVIEKIMAKFRLGSTN
jgi:hypothetical protein